MLADMWFGIGIIIIVAMMVLQSWLPAAGQFAIVVVCVAALIFGKKGN